MFNKTLVVSPFDPRRGRSSEAANAADFSENVDYTRGVKPKRVTSEGPST